MIKEKYDLYINRELSWLKFNERVLQEAECSDNPLFEEYCVSDLETNFDIRDW